MLFLIKLLAQKDNFKKLILFENIQSFTLYVFFLSMSYENKKKRKVKYIKEKEKEISNACLFLFKLMFSEKVRNCIYMKHLHEIFNLMLV